MTTNQTVTTSQAQNWKWISGILAIVLAMLIVGIAVESYFLYQMARQPLPTAPALAPKTPLPKGPALNTITSPLDDTDISEATAAGGSPGDQLFRLHQQMEQLFNEALNQAPDADAAILSAVSSPNLDVREEKDHYTVRVDMPGARKDSIKVSVEGRLITISGERTLIQETKDSDKVIRSERSMAQFVRTLQLPGSVNAGTVEAKYDNGVLTLNLPKSTQAASATQIPIR